MSKAYSKNIAANLALYLQRSCDNVMSGGYSMFNIKKISALRNYTEVLSEISSGSPLFLTKNGEGRYVIIDIEEYESLKQSLWQRLFSELDESVAVAERFGWVSEDKANEYMDGLLAHDKA
jgi:prevent-host-death family protein